MESLETQQPASLLAAAGKPGSKEVEKRIGIRDCPLTTTMHMTHAPMFTHTAHFTEQTNE